MCEVSQKFHWTRMRKHSAQNIVVKTIFLRFQNACHNMEGCKSECHQR